MTSPKHLWSGDWERDSEAAARDRALRRGPEVAPDESEVPPPAAQQPRIQTPRRPLRRPRVSRAHVRLALVVAGVALLVAGGAWGLSALVGSSNTGSAAAGSPPWIGMQMQSLANGTVVVSSVVPGSPADAAGLRPGDVVTEVESRPVGAPIDVTEAVAALSPGDTIEIQVVRGSDTYTAQVKLTARPASFP